MRGQLLRKSSKDMEKATGSAGTLSVQRQHRPRGARMPSRRARSRHGPTGRLGGASLSKLRHISRQICKNVMVLMSELFNELPPLGCKEKRYQVMLYKDEKAKAVSGKRWHHGQESRMSWHDSCTVSVYAVVESVYAVVESVYAVVVPVYGFSARGGVGSSYVL